MTLPEAPRPTGLPSPLTINGATHPSHGAAARAIGITRQALASRLRHALARAERERAGCACPTRHRKACPLFVAMTHAKAERPTT